MAFNIDDLFIYLYKQFWFNVLELYKKKSSYIIVYFTETEVWIVELETLSRISTDQAHLTVFNLFYLL